MNISALVRKDTMNGHQQILAVYSSPLKAFEAFKARFRQNKSPYTGGVDRYSDKEMFNYALNEAKGHLLIYQNQQFELFIQWNILDQPLR